MDMYALSQALSRREPSLLGARRHYAVLVPLVRWKGELCLLYETRAANLRRQPRETCFPGGRMEPGERAEDCALRETWEELGIPQDCVEVLGRLDFLAHRANFIVYPILAYLRAEGLSHLRPSPAEVDSVFFVPLSHLREHPPQEFHYSFPPLVPEDFPFERVGIPRDYSWQRGQESVPIYYWEDTAIWGLTGRITQHLLALLSELTDTNPCYTRER